MTITPTTAHAVVQILRETYPHARGFQKWRINLRPYGTPFEEVLKHIPLHACVLDVGCGIGMLTTLVALTRQPQRVVGIDINAKTIAIGKESVAAKDPRVQFLHLPPLEFPAETFDVVTCVDVLHHVVASQQTTFLKLLNRSLRPGGILLLKDLTLLPRWKLWCSRLFDLLVSRQWISVLSAHTVESLLNEKSLGTTELLEFSSRCCFDHFLLIWKKQ
jgi:2-polyprenyl-3-methyl-5-hydroxy-6-metoxy-1,4-benzoquinol methylase